MTKFPAPHSCGLSLLGWDPVPILLRPHLDRVYRSFLAHASSLSPAIQMHKRVYKLVLVFTAAGLSQPNLGMNFSVVSQCFHLLSYIPSQQTLGLAPGTGLHTQWLRCL